MRSDLPQRLRAHELAAIPGHTGLNRTKIIDGARYFVIEAIGNEIVGPRGSQCGSTALPVVGLYRVDETTARDLIEDPVTGEMRRKRTHELDVELVPEAEFTALKEHIEGSRQTSESRPDSAVGRRIGGRRRTGAAHAQEDGMIDHLDRKRGAGRADRILLDYEQSIPDGPLDKLPGREPAQGPIAWDRELDGGVKERRRGGVIRRRPPKEAAAALDESDDATVTELPVPDEEPEVRPDDNRPQDIPRPRRQAR